VKRVSPGSHPVDRDEGRNGNDGHLLVVEVEADRGIEEYAEASLVALAVLLPRRPVLQVRDVGSSQASRCKVTTDRPFWTTAKGSAYALVAATIIAIASILVMGSAPLARLHGLAN
jgi:hypothetical protein